MLQKISSFGTHKLNQVLSDIIPIPLHKTRHEFHEILHSVTFYFMKKDSKQCCDTTTPESIHTKDESKRGTSCAFILGVN